MKMGVKHGGGLTEEEERQGREELTNNEGLWTAGAVLAILVIGLFLLDYWLRLLC